jgi:hypothetical protein
LAGGAAGAAGRSTGWPFFQGGEAGRADASVEAARAPRVLVVASSRARCVAIALRDERRARETALGLPGLDGSTVERSVAPRA